MNPIDYNDEPKHKKKSIAKGQPRSKHKHEYEIVLFTAQRLRDKGANVAQ